MTKKHYVLLGIKKASLIILALSIASCGYTHGLIKHSLTKTENTVQITFTSYPDGADVIIYGQNRGKTPLTLDLVPDGYYKGVIAKKGYANREFTLTRNNGYRIGHRNGWCTADAIGYFLILPLFSASSDYCATLTPNVIFVTLDEGNRVNVKIHDN